MDTTKILENDIDYQQFTAHCDEQHFASMERNHPAFETCAAIQRATGCADVVVFDGSAPDFSWERVHAIIRANFDRVRLS